MTCIYTTVLTKRLLISSTYKIKYQKVSLLIDILLSVSMILSSKCLFLNLKKVITPNNQKIEKLVIQKSWPILTLNLTVEDWKQMNWDEKVESSENKLVRRRTTFDFSVQQCRWKVGSKLTTLTVKKSS